MPLCLFKGEAARELDRWYRRGDVGENLIEARSLLSSHSGLAAVVRALRAPDKGNPWSTDSAFDFPSHAPLMSVEFERVAQQGYLEAIGLALQHSPPVPISTFWLTGAGNATFEMHIVDAEDHVSVTVAIPDTAIVETPGTPSFAMSGPASWVVKDQGAEATPAVSQTSGTDMGERPRPSTVSRPSTG